ncbi:MAG: hypothetical protein JW900_11655 [Anaerolineae bacterium]|nr:hypothetical protein [Anaerolineae bacterium]
MKLQPKLWRRLTARFYHLRGMAHRHVGNRQGDVQEHCRAVQDFAQALRLNPQLIQARYDRGVLLWRELADGLQAQSDLDQVIALDPTRSETWFQRAFARQIAGDIDGAIADFQRYVANGEDATWQEISRQQIDNLRALQDDERKSGR